MGQFAFSFRFRSVLWQLSGMATKKKKPKQSRRDFSQTAFQVVQQATGIQELKPKVKK
jgi:hypothetical protein